MIIFIILVIVAIIIVAACVNTQKEKERQENRVAYDYSNYNRIISDLKNWNNQRLTSFLEELNTEYNNLRVSMQKPIGAGYACKAIMWTGVEGATGIEMLTFSVDIDGIIYLRKYVIDEMQRRGIA